MSHDRTGEPERDRQPTGAAPADPSRRAAEPTTSAGHPLLRMQAAAGNQATMAALDAQASLQVGSADDPYEREAEAVARRVVAGLAADAPAVGPDAGPVRRILRRSPKHAQRAVGPEGGTVDADAEAQLRTARSGGTPLPDLQRERLESAFGGADFGDVRLHQGGAAADLNDRFGARAFTVGSDIFFGGAAPDLASRAGTELLAHELTHTVQQSEGTAHRQLIRRDFVGTWDETLKKLSSDAQLGYSQFVALNGEGAAERIKAGCTVKSGEHAGKFDTDRAEGIWSKKVMTTEAFDEALAKKKTQETADVKTLLGTMNHLCNETDGTHRPGSVGDGSSEWALKWEAEHGEPFRSPSGHSIKLRDYCKVLSEGLATLSAKKGSVGPTETMTWKENNKAAETEVNVLSQLALVVTRATDRLAKMREGVAIWNTRVTRYPDKWNTDGTSALTPPGVDPLAKGQLKAGWPKDKTVKEY